MKEDRDIPLANALHQFACRVKAAIEFSEDGAVHEDDLADLVEALDHVAEKIEKALCEYAK